MIGHLDMSAPGVGDSSAEPRGKAQKHRKSVSAMIIRVKYWLANLSFY